MIQFFQSVMGRTFYEGTMPRIARALEAIGAEMKRANDLSQEETAPLPAVVPDGEAAEKAVQDILRRMFDAADDYNVSVLDEIILAAGILWQCECGGSSLEGAHDCVSCGKPKGGAL
jgi:hypothetical protein